jgi:ABC-2 type transport system permease protein
LLPVFIGIFSILGIGLIFGGLALIFKKIQSLLNIVQYFFIALVMVSPENEIIYNLLPFRPAADNVMISMRRGLSFIDFSIYNYGIMIGNSILYFSIGLFVFNKCVKFAKMKGLLGQY